MKKFKLHTNESGLGTVVLILLIVGGVLVAGGAGYAIGHEMAKNDAKTMYDKQVQSLQKEVDSYKSAAGTKVTEGQDTVESLQAENATLTTKVDDLTKQVADLQKQLDEANGTTPPTTN